MNNNHKKDTSKILGPLTIGASIAAGLWGAGVLSLEWAAATGTVISALTVSKLGRGVLINKAAMATGAAVFALAMGMPISPDMGALGLSILSFTFQHPVGLMLAGFGGLLTSRIIRSEWGEDRVRKRHKTISKEIVGTAGGITGFLAGTFAGPALSGSKHSNLTRVQNVFDNEGFWGAYEAISHQRNEIFLHASNAINEHLKGAKTAMGWIQELLNTTPKPTPDQFEALNKITQHPDVKSALIVLGSSIAMAVLGYMGAKAATYPGKDYPEGMRAFREGNSAQPS